MRTFNFLSQLLFTEIILLLCFNGALKAPFQNCTVDNMMINFEELYFFSQIFNISFL